MKIGDVGRGSCWPASNKKGTITNEKEETQKGNGGETEGWGRGEKKEGCKSVH